MSEMCCTRLAGNKFTGRKKWPSAHHRTTLSGYISATKSHIDNRKKIVKQQYLPTCPYNIVNFGPLTAEIGSGVWGTGHPMQQLQRVSRLGSFTAPTSLTGGQPNFVRSLAVSWAGTLYINFRGLLPPGGILPRAKFTLCLSLAFASPVLVGLLHGI